jgi:hypothetical protein
MGITEIHMLSPTEKEVSIHVEETGRKKHTRPSKDASERTI